MKAEYDLSKMKFRKNPYASKLKKPVTMRLSEDVVDYLKRMADDARWNVVVFLDSRFGRQQVFAHEALHRGQKSVEFSAVFVRLHGLLLSWSVVSV